VKVAWNSPWCCCDFWGGIVAMVYLLVNVRAGI